MTDKAANGANGEWQAVVASHGHSCPGLALGYRVAKAALRELGENRAGMCWYDVKGGRTMPSPKSA